MTDHDEILCPGCGRPQEGGSGELCPACLIRLGLEESGSGEDSIPAASGSDGRSAPDRIGPYRIDRLLGEGGMGRVYLAHQEHPIRRTVALKLIKQGIDSRETMARFETERRSLELMHHPSIARVLDAGSTTDGRPWFVMEYVDGLPINRFCDENHLTTEQRLRLVIRVCEAVQHAHVKGVIHRDLKPSNVLVTTTDDGPLPKVIDFGIAKATGERMLEWTRHTEMGRLIGTPEYMSPEQADTSRRDVDTRTDVYALGVMLYELLVGRTPHDADSIRDAGLEEMLRLIREEELAAPSSRLSTLGDDATAVAVDRSTDPGRLMRQVRGELDWITMRALEKDRERRYGSSRELAEDLERYLSNEPIHARAPSRGYRMQKFVRRHRLGVGVTVAALMVLVLFAGAMTWQAGRIARERDKARVEAATSERVAGLMVDLFRSADPFGTAGSDLSAQDVLKTGADRVIRELTDDPELQARMLAEMGWSFDGLGDYDRAGELLERSVELYRSLWGEHDERTLRAMQYLGKVYYGQERPEDAEAMFRGVVTGFEANLGAGHRRTLGSRLYLPEELIDAGRYEEAIMELEPLLADQVEALGAGDQDTLFTGVLLATALSHSGRKGEAAPHIDDALVGLQFPNDEYDDDQAVRMMRLGWVCLFLERLDDSEQVYRRVLDRREVALGQDHPQTLQTRSMLASILSQQGRHDESAEESHVILEARTRILGADHPDTLQTLSMLGDSLIMAERYTEAEEQFRSAVERYERTGQGGFWSARSKLGLGRAIRLNGRLEEALILSYQVQEYCDDELSDRHPICNGNLRDIGHILQKLGDEEGVARIRARLNALEKTK